MKTLEEPHKALREKNKALWEKGDFTRIASFMRESGEELAQSLKPLPTMRILDLGCGDGTTALPLARSGAEVLGVDISAPLLKAGARRAAQEGLSRLSFQEGDACDLEGIPDASFDLVVSIFGAMFAPRPFDVARQMVRVAKPGGRVVMGNWIPGDPTFVSQLLKIASGYLPPPPAGAASPIEWGIEKHVIERFAHACVPEDRIEMRRNFYHLQSPDISPEGFIGLFENYYGPTMNAFAAAGDRAGDLRVRLMDLAREHNQARGKGTLIKAAYLRVTVRV
jgi:SAM-dependent methyltransferase